MKYNTLIEIFEKPSHTAGITFIEGSTSEYFLSYNELYKQSLCILNLLQSRGIKKGDELVFQISSNKNFIITFWACILGGVIPIPLVLSRTDDHFLKLYNILNILNKPYIISSPKQIEKFNDFLKVNSLCSPDCSIVFESILEEKSECISSDLLHPKEDDIAYIQFSSGSTGTPKGVKLTHKNLITNAYSIIQGICPPDDGDRFFSWMPLSHDMGLIGFHITPTVAGWSHYIMPTELFIRRPSIWLQKVSEHKITFTASPNFGYRYLLNRIDNNILESINLSSIRMIANGAEPISAELSYEFIEKFKVCGLHINGIFPVYGLAEASLAVTFSKPQENIKTLCLHRQYLNNGDKIIKIRDGNGITIVNVGKPLNGTFIRISANGKLVKEEEIVGNIQIKGDNVTKGYYKNEVATKSIITKDGWLDTGDLGFISSGCLYITGRAKDIIFVNGQNFYPHDIEKCLEKIEKIELGKVALGAYFNDSLKKEEILVFVLFKDRADSFIKLSNEIKALINRRFGFEVDNVLPVREIPKTTSGKLQRYKLVEQYKSGKFTKILEEITSITTEVEKNNIIHPQNNIEKKVFDIWSKVLDKKDFGTTSNFFEIGGDSLRGAQILSLLYNEFGIELNSELLFDKPTISELSLEIGLRERKTFLSIPKTVESDHYPLNSSQRRLYYFWKINKESTAYNIPTAFQITGFLDIIRLEQCIQNVIERYDIFRTFFGEEDSNPFQYLHQKVQFKLICSDVDENTLKKKLFKKVLPFDLHKAPLFRIELFKLSESKHFLFADFHHIILDGFSVYNFWNELLQIYHDKKLSSVELQFRDFVNWEIHNKLSKRYIEQGEFWSDQYKNEIPLLTFPLDYVRPIRLNYKGEKIEFEINKDLSTRLKRFAAEKNVTLFMMLLASYEILLSKYTGQEDIIIGVPHSGRKHIQFYSTIGMFVNNLSLRSYPKGEKNFEEFLQETKENITKAFDNSEYSFDELVEKIDLKKDPSRNLLFDFMFVFQNFNLQQSKTNSLSVNRYFFDPGISKYDITLEVFNEEESIKYYLEYSTELFKKETILNFSRHYQNILEQLIAFPKIQLSEISTICTTEVQQYIQQFNDTKTDFFNVPIIKLIEHQVIINPDKTSIVDENGWLTYKQLNDKSNQLANVLIKKGVTNNIPVVIFMDRSSNLIIGILAVLKAGGYYIPIDIDTPIERAKYIFTDSQAKIFLTEHSSYSTIENSIKQISSNELIIIDSPEIVINTSSQPQINSSASDLAYIIYTSGTTGKPKGVKIENQSLVNYITWAKNTYVNEEKKDFPLFTSISFDLTITSIFLPLVNGNTMYIYKDDDKHLSFEKVIESNKVDIIKLTPSHLRLLLSSSKLIEKLKKSNIRKLIVGGENLTTQVAKEIHLLFSKNNIGVNIYNEYGPTEATVGCMIYLYNPNQDKNSSVPIGKPISNTQIYLLDKYLKPVPIGVTGEIYISGDSLSKGYFHNPALTDSVFINNPFHKGKMYKTGDIAKRLEDGNIEYIGRADQQVKMRGFRIELGEIENQLLQHDKISQVIVEEKRNNKEENYLCAYYVKKDSSSGPEISELKKFLVSRLPVYMIPSCFIAIKEMPLTPHGKVNYRALPEPNIEFEKGQTALPKNPIELLLVQIWQEILSNDKIGIDSNFYEIGGDSIKAVQIASKLNEKGISLNTKDILTYQTIEQISLYTKAICDTNQYEQGIIEGEIELNPIQRWFTEQNFNNPNYYNQSVLLEFKEEINLSCIEKTFKILIEHHDGLRLNYNHETHKLFYNNELLNERFLIEIINIPNEDKAAINKQLVTFGQKLKKSINIFKGFPIRACIFQKNNSSLLITAHHFVIDGISWRILLDDFYTIYCSLKNQTTYCLPSKTATLKEWYNQIETFSKSETLLKEIEYWQHIENTSFEIPKDFQKEEPNSTNSEKIRKSLNKEQTQFLLKEANKVYNTDVQTLLIVGLVRAINEWTNAQEIVIELENHGRHLDNIDISKTIGWFTTMYPVLFNINKNSLGEQIKYIKEQIRKVPHNGTGYGILKYISKKINAEIINPQIRFNYLGQFDNEMDNDVFQYSFSDTGSEMDPSNSFTTQIEINCMIIKGLFTLEINFNNKRFKQTTIVNLCDSYFRHLFIIIDHIQNENSVHFTPTDFDAVELDENDLKILFG